MQLLLRSCIFFGLSILLVIADDNRNDDKNLDETKSLLSLFDQLYEPVDLKKFAYIAKNCGENEPELSLIDPQESFSSFIPSHQRAANALTKIFLSAKTYKEFNSLAVACRNTVNPHLFIHSFTLALLHREDTANIILPPLSEVVPDRFVSKALIKKARREVQPLNSRQPGKEDTYYVEIPEDWTGTNGDPEHKVAYWREDIGLNLHHWHWHLVFPLGDNITLVEKDRRGELFYYMHHQIMARFSIERLCNELPKVRPLDDLRQPIPEAYFSKLSQENSDVCWPGRPANITPSHISRIDKNNVFTIDSMEESISRIKNAIDEKTALDNQDNLISLDDKTGIDILGNMVQSNILSPNQDYYGDLHNHGHLLLAYIHDPNGYYKEPSSLMAEEATALRDPVFYRWHQYIDDLFASFKDSLPPYDIKQLDFSGVTINRVQVQTSKFGPNTLNTYWTKSNFKLSRGLSFGPNVTVFARVKHLDHARFSYKILVTNLNKEDVKGTVRIFLAPKFYDNDEPLGANEQRQLMIEMDKFNVTLKRGQNTIVRKSNESSLVMNIKAIENATSQNRPSEEDLDKSNAFSYSGCGWPEYLLVPKGNAEGYPMDLFVMISNLEQDKVPLDSIIPPQSPSLCGVSGRKYPDTRSMGYPFDRTIEKVTLTDFLTPNMKIQPITIKFTESRKQ